MEIQYKDVDIKIQISRWDIVITIRQKGGKKVQYIASADEGVTFGDGIYFGSIDDYNELINSL